MLVLYLTFIIAYGWDLVKFKIQYTDFPTFYYSALTVFRAGDSPYDLERLTELGASLGQNIRPFLYPPPALFILYPLIFFTYPAASNLFLVLNHVLLLAIFGVLTFKILRVRKIGLFILIIFCYTFSFRPFIENLRLGQVNLIALLSICLFWYLLIDNKPDWSIAILLSIAIWLKSYPIFFLLYFLSKKRIGLILWTTGFLLLFALITWLTLPGTLWNEWINKVLLFGGYANPLPHMVTIAIPQNQSLNGFISRLLFENPNSQMLLHNPQIARFLAISGSLVILAVTFWTVFKRKGLNYPPEFQALEISVFLSAIFLASPLSWDAHLIFIWAPILVLLHYLYNSNEIQVVIAIPILIAAGVLALQFPYSFKLPESVFWSFALSAKFYMVLIIWGVTLYLIKKYPETYSITS